MAVMNWLAVFTVLSKEYKNDPIITHSYAVLLPRLSGYRTDSNYFHEYVYITTKIATIYSVYEDAKILRCVFHSI